MKYILKETDTFILLPNDAKHTVGMDKIALSISHSYKRNGEQFFSSSILNQCAELFTCGQQVCSQFQNIEQFLYVKQSRQLCFQLVSSRWNADYILMGTRQL